MINLQDRIPAYLTQKQNLVHLILFTAAFALIFINIYAPFGVETWYSVTRWELLLYSSLVILTGVLVVVVSRVLMYHVCKTHSISYVNYLFWMLAEVFCMAMFYGVFEKFILDDAREFMSLLKVSVINTALVLLLPYSVMWLYFSWNEKKRQLALLDRGSDGGGNPKNMVPFHDEKGILRFSVTRDNLLYLEAADNYINIFYRDKELVSRFMLRNTLKKMEEVLACSEIIRCHRSFMVNFERVTVIRKEKEGLRLELDGNTTPNIPVSKTYLEKVMDTFSKYSGGKL